MDRSLCPVQEYDTVGISRLRQYIDDDTEAYRIASDLDVQYDAHGPRPADAVRKVDPAQPVQRAEWTTGELDVWIRNNGEWLGRFCDKYGRITWIPGSELRPL